MSSEAREVRLWYVGGAVIVALATVGFFTGIAGTARTSSWKASAAAPSATVRAPSYKDLRTEQRGPNASLYGGALERLGEQRPGLYNPVVQTDEDLRRVLAARAERRAFDGAPPTIPHAIAQSAAPDCLGCHEDGAMIAGKRAPRMSHARYAACTQCHVPVAPRAGMAPDSPPPNTFVGAPSPERGERAWLGAPPMIPHATVMRSECGACHGVTGRLGMRSTHPYRESCTQCHAPSATLDQRPVAATGRVP